MSVNDSVELSAGDKTSCDEDEVLLLDTGESGRSTAKFILGGEVGSWYRGWGEGGEVLLLDTGESSRSTAKFILGGEVGSWYRGWGEGVMMPHCYG